MKQTKEWTRISLIMNIIIIIMIMITTMISIIIMIIIIILVMMMHVVFPYTFLVDDSKGVLVSDQWTTSNCLLLTCTHSTV